MPANSAPDTRPPFSPNLEETPFLRLWHGFLTGRVMVALALPYAYLHARSCCCKRWGN